MWKKFFDRTLHLETNERKNIALWLMFGGTLVFTAYAIAGLWLVASKPAYVFWLAVIAHVQIFSIMAGFIGQLIKRRIAVSKDGMSITDLDEMLKHLPPSEVYGRTILPGGGRLPHPGGFEPDFGDYGGGFEEPYDEGYYDEGPGRRHQRRGNRIGLDLDFEFGRKVDGNKQAGYQDRSDSGVSESIPKDSDR